MKNLYLNDIIKIINGRHSKENNVLINHVSDDINKLKENTVVFHLYKDEEVNVEAFNKLQNCYIVCDHPLLKTMMIDKNRYIFVDNIQEAYKTFRNYYRNLFDIPVVAVTGTCGKTTTKEMISQILENKHKVVHTISSKNALRFNNDYLMSFDDSTEFGVFETAITHPGNLLHGCEIYKPSIGIITTIGIDHLNWCKSLDSYIRTKSEMLTGLQNKGTLILNNDDRNIKKIDMSDYQGKIITFGIENPSDFYGKNIKFGKEGMDFVLENKGKEHKAFVPGYGEHNVKNALATLAALDTLGMELSEAINYLAKFKHIRSHVEFKEGINNSTIIDDTWSSNPTSMNEALKVLNGKGKDKIKIAVIGKINYLGEFKDIYYEKIAKMVIKHKINRLITLDNDAKKIGEYALEYGFEAKDLYHITDNTELTHTLKGMLNEKTIILFKFSMLDKSHQRVLRKVILKETK